jgi:hypothetical protein
LVPTQSASGLVVDLAPCAAAVPENTIPESDIASTANAMARAGMAKWPECMTVPF